MQIKSLRHFGAGFVRKRISVRAQGKVIDADLDRANNNNRARAT
jgi:hypothetical protein